MVPTSLVGTEVRKYDSTSVRKTEYNVSSLKVTFLKKAAAIKFFDGSFVRLFAIFNIRLHFKLLKWRLPYQTHLLGL